MFCFLSLLFRVLSYNSVLSFDSWETHFLGLTARYLNLLLVIRDILNLFFFFLIYWQRFKNTQWVKVKLHRVFYNSWRWWKLVTLSGRDLVTDYKNFKILWLLEVYFKYFDSKVWCITLYVVYYFISNNKILAKSEFLNRELIK